jgi:hypothetical protein
MYDGTKKYDPHVREGVNLRFGKKIKAKLLETSANLKCMEYQQYNGLYNISFYDEPKTCTYKIHKIKDDAIILYHYRYELFEQIEYIEIKTIRKNNTIIYERED